MAKTWFITGTSRGFGRIWAEAALARGDRVAATARDPQALAPLVAAHGEAVLPLALDVTDRAAVFAAVAEAHRRFGRLDVVVCNAGYGLLGAIEEVSIDEARANLETNVFGTLHVIQAALPLLRAQASGHIIAVSSLGGVVALPMFFQATKFAIEGIAEALAGEVEPFGIKVTIVEPGSYATSFFSESSLRHAQALPAYQPQREALMALAATSGFGDPAATAPAILAIVDSAQPPLRCILGSTALPLIRDAYAKRLATWEQWRELSDRAQGGIR